MSTKTLKKELLAAVAMMLVALLALSGSTYAWFASNTKVTAGNMNVSAASANPFLHIATGSAAENKHGEYDTFVTFDNTKEASAAGLKLVAPGTIGAVTTGDNDVEWYWAVSTNPAVATSAGTAASATTSGVGTGAGYVLMEKLTIKNDSSIDAENLEVSVTFPAIAEKDKSLDDSVRVLIITTEGAYACFGRDGKATSAKAAGAPLDLKVKDGASEGVASKGGFNVRLAETLASSSSIDIEVYLYFDGNDSYSKNITTVSAVQLTCALSFTIKGDTDNSATKPVS